VCVCVCVWITLCHQLVRMLDRTCNVTGTAALLAASVRDNRTAVVRVQRSEHVELMVQRLPGAIGVLLSHAFQGLVPAAALSTGSGVSSAFICVCSRRAAVYVCPPCLRVAWSRSCMEPGSRTRFVRLKGEGVCAAERQRDNADNASAVCSPCPYYTNTPFVASTRVCA
jgi:hypothetical protein